MYRSAVEIRPYKNVTITEDSTAHAGAAVAATIDERDPSSIHGAYFFKINEHALGFFSLLFFPIRLKIRFYI